MKQINIDKPIFDRIEHKQKDKANTVFIKLLAKNRRKANPWGVVRSETLPIDKSDIRNELEVK